MINIDYTDKSFDIKKTKNYIISTQISLSGYTICIKNKEDKVLLLKQNIFNQTLTENTIGSKYKKIFKANKILTAKYHKAECIYTTEKTTWIPGDFFKKENVKDYLSFVSDINNTDKVEYAPITSAGIYTIFSIPEDLKELIKQQMPQAKILHQSNVMANLASTNINQEEKATVWVNANYAFFDVLVMKNGKPILYNTFKYSNEKEFAYFVMLIYQKLELKTEENQLLLSGRITENEPAYSILRELISDIKFWGKKQLKYDGVPTHYFALVN